MSVTAFDQQSCRGGTSEDVPPCGGAVTDFESFWKREAPGLVRFTQSRIASDLDAEDVVSDAMYELWKKWPALGTERENPEQLRRYSYGVVKNIIHTHARRTARCRSTDDLDPVWDRNPVETFVASQITQVDLCEALAAMPTQQFRTLLMCAYGMDSEEIAAAMAARASTVRSRIVVARQLLRRLQQCDPSGSIRADAQAKITKERRSARALRALVRGLAGVGVIAGTAAILPTPAVLFDVEPITNRLPTLWRTQPAQVPEGSNVPNAPVSEPTAPPSPSAHAGVRHAKPAPASSEKHPVLTPTTQHPPKATGAVDKVVGEVHAVVNGVIGSMSGQLSSTAQQTSQVLRDGATQTGRLLSNILDTNHADSGQPGDVPERSRGRL